MSEIRCPVCHDNRVSCNNCKHLWHYSPDMSSPYGELSCKKGHWDGVEDPKEIYNLIECEDFDGQDE